MNDEIRCVVPAGDSCGEGAVWHPEQCALYWTDINRFLVHRFEPHGQTIQTWFFAEPVTSVNLTTDALSTASLTDGFQCIISDYKSRLRCGIRSAIDGP